MRTNLPVFAIKEFTVRRRYSDFVWLRKEIERTVKIYIPGERKILQINIFSGYYNTYTTHTHPYICMNKLKSCPVKHSENSCQYWQKMTEYLSQISLKKDDKGQKNLSTVWRGTLWYKMKSAFILFYKRKILIKKDTCLAKLDSRKNMFIFITNY